MERREFLRLSGLAAAGLIAGGCAGSREARMTVPNPRPNILWITIEDTSLFFGCYGDKTAKTPHVDQLAREGTLFTNAFASSPVCSPARSALITGMYVGQLGAGCHRSVVDIPSYVKGYPVYLREAGYYCTNHTKNDFNFTDSWHWANRTWDDTSQKASWRNRKPGQPFFSVVNLVDTHQSRTSVNSYARFQKNIQSQLAPEEITDPNAVELPPFYYDSPRMRKAYARMYDCITLVDKQIGAILQQLADDGLADDTIVFFFSDHGQGMPRFKTTPLGLGFQVPMVVRVPEKYRAWVGLTPGGKTDRIVSFVDLGPTVLHLAGVEIPEQMAGVPVLGPNWVKKKYFYGSMNDIGAAENHSRAIYDGRYWYTRNYMPHLAYTQSQRYNDGAEILHFMRQDKKAGRLTGAAAEFMADRRPAEALYDLANDPWEVNNLAGDRRYRRVLERLRRVNREKILEIRDLHFLHPWEIETRGGALTACEIRTDRERYPLEKILAAAELTGGGAAVLDRQLACLEDKEPMVRYWGLIGLQSQDWQRAAVMEKVTKRLADSAPYVRYEAAKLSYQWDRNAAARAVLIKGIRESHSILVNSAMRKIRQLNGLASDFMDEVQALKKRYKQLADKKKIYEIGTSIEGVENYLAGREAAPVDSF